jgi:hypothetical protein
MYSPRRLGCFLARLVMLHHLSQHHREGPVDVVVSPADIQHSKSKYYIHQYQPATSRRRKPWLSYACPSRTTRSLPSLRHSSAPSNDLPASVNVSKDVLHGSAVGQRYQPTVCVSGMQEVELSPCQRSPWLRGRVDCVRLHPANISREDHISLGVLAAFASERRGAQHGECKSCRRPMHRCDRVAIT